MTLPVLSHPEYELTLPSTKEKIKYRSFLVKEEKILMLAAEGSNSEIMNSVKSIIEVCTFGKIDVDNLASFDVEYIFLKLRAKSKGETIEIKHECEECKTENSFQINIDEIEVIFQENHSNKIELENNVGIIMKYPVITMGDSLKDDKDIDGIFNLIVSCIDYIYDSEATYKPSDSTKEEMLEFVNSMNDAQFKKVQTFFQTIPSLRKEIPYKCKGKKCTNKTPIVLEGLQSFLD